MVETREPKKLEKITDLVPDPHNLNRGTVRGQSIIERSLEKNGAARSVVTDADGVVLAGNKTHQIAAEKDFKIRTVQTEGDELVVVQRVDVRIGEGEIGKRIAVSDNRAAELGLDWDFTKMLEDLEDGVSYSDYFTDNELSKELGDKLKLQDIAGSEDDEFKPLGEGEGDEGYARMIQLLYKVDEHSEMMLRLGEIKRQRELESIAQTVYALVKDAYSSFK